MRNWLPIILHIGVTFAAQTCCGQNVTGYATITDPFLFLLREPAVQEDLGLSDDQMQQLVALNERFDGDLLASRNMPAQASQETVTKVMEQSREGVAQIFSEQQLNRLRQISYRLRGISFVLTPHVAKQLELTSTQQTSIQSIVSKTLESLGTLQKQLASGETSKEQANKTELQIREKEQRQVLQALDSRQQRQVSALVGREFDLTKLGRVTFRAPEFSDTGIWINSDELRLSQLHGKVIALHFWAFGCINCIRNYPWYKGWDDRYADQGLVIVGVHTPETAREREVERVRDKVEEEQLSFPVVIDNDEANWNSWGNSMWPSVYLVDKKGRLRYWWYGELDWNGAGGQEIMSRRIEELLAEKP